MIKVEEEFHIFLEAIESTVVSRGHNSRREQIRWLKPTREFVKANWDAVINGKKTMMGIGIVIRDHMGEILACLSAPKSFCGKPFLAEAWALKSTVEFCKELEL